MPWPQAVTKAIMGKHDKKEKHSKKRHHSSDEETSHRDHRKSQKKAEKIAKAFGYSNDINPFGDSSLLKPFVWGKKQEKELKEGKPKSDPEQERLKLMADIEKVFYAFAVLLSMCLTSFIR